MSCWQDYWLALELPCMLATDQSAAAHSQPRAARNYLLYTVLRFSQTFGPVSTVHNCLLSISAGDNISAVLDFETLVILTSSPY